MWPSEKQFANLLTKQKREWEYPTKRFDLGNTTYRPDFFLPKENLYIEVIGTRQAYHAHKNKIIKLRKLYPNIRLIIVDIYNNPFPHIKQKTISKFKMRTVKPRIVTRSVKVPANLYFQIREIAILEDKLILNIMAEALEDYLKKHNKKK